MQMAMVGLTSFNMTRTRWRLDRCDPVNASGTKGTHRRVQASTAAASPGLGWEDRMSADGDDDREDNEDHNDDEEERGGGWGSFI